MKIALLYGNGAELNQVVTLPNDYKTEEEAFEVLCSLVANVRKEGFTLTYMQGQYHWFINRETGATRGIFIMK